MTVAIKHPEIKTERRWLRSVIAASAQPLPAFPWMRGQRRRPEAVDPAPAAPLDLHAVPLFGGRAAVAAH